MKRNILFLLALSLVLIGAACSKTPDRGVYMPLQNTNQELGLNVNTSSTTGTFTTNTTVNTNAVTNTSTGTAALPLAQRVSDAASTLSNPVKVAMTDGRGYFIVGQPKGQNSKTTKKIIFSLPGHDTTAETDYDA